MKPDRRGLHSEGRRRFLRAAVGAAFACPAIAACEFVELRDTDGPGAGGASLPFDLAEPAFAGLANVGGSACLAAGPVELLLLRADEDEILAFERFCPHNNLPIAGCAGGGPPLDWDGDRQQLRCMWHDSIFARDGARVSGPAPRGLQVYPVRFDADAGTGVVLVAGAPGLSAASEAGSGSDSRSGGSSTSDSSTSDSSTTGSDAPEPGEDR